MRAKTLLIIMSLFLIYLYLPESLVNEVYRALKPFFQDLWKRINERVISLIKPLFCFERTITNTVIIEKKLITTVFTTVTSTLLKTVYKTEYSITTVTRTLTITKTFVPGSSIETEVRGKVIVVTELSPNETLIVTCSGEMTLALGGNVILYQVYQGNTRAWKIANAEKVIPCDAYFETVIKSSTTFTVAATGEGSVGVTVVRG